MHYTVKYKVRCLPKLFLTYRGVTLYSTLESRWYDRTFSLLVFLICLEKACDWWGQAMSCCDTKLAPKSLWLNMTCLFLTHTTCPSWAGRPQFVTSTHSGFQTTGSPCCSCTMWNVWLVNNGTRDLGAECSLPYAGKTHHSPLCCTGQSSSLNLV